MGHERFTPLYENEQKKNDAQSKRKMIQKDSSPGGELYDSNFDKSLNELEQEKKDVA